MCIVNTTLGTNSTIKGGSAYLHAYSEANGKGTILWSWHIWVLPNGEADVKPLINTYLGKGIMMNRAIGAIGKTAGVNSFGMMYQWGRKDPFTPATTTAGKDTQLYNATGTPINTKSSGGLGGEWIHSTTALNASQVATLINYPSTFYTGNGVEIASTGNLSNDWWNPATKTLYDPCPSGYRIPEVHTYGYAGADVISHTGWSAFQSSGLNSGRNWTVGSSFFPASGQRNYSNGQFGYVGSYGYAWMSTPGSATYGYSLAFLSGAVYPNSAYYRSFGFPVRCISE